VALVAKGTAEDHLEAAALEMSALIASVGREPCDGEPGQ
jgi:hypothetical protein